MAIRPIGETNAASAATRRSNASGPAPTPAARAGDARPGDRFERRAAETTPDEAPFWLLQMANDRLAGRQYLSRRAARAAAGAEEAWVRKLVSAAAPVGAAHLAAGVAPHGAPGLASLQTLADGLVAAAGPFFGPVRVVWLTGKLAGRGQFLFQLEGNLIQLRPAPPARDEAPAEWLETVAHETFHHLQQELITALYRGSPALPAEPADLAAYYRDARAIYLPPSLALTAAEHQRQTLEVGAWTFGARLAKVAATMGKG